MSESSGEISGYSDRLKAELDAAIVDAVGTCPVSQGSVICVSGSTVATLAYESGRLSFIDIRQPGQSAVGHTTHAGWKISYPPAEGIGALLVEELYLTGRADGDPEESSARGLLDNLIVDLVTDVLSEGNIICSNEYSELSRRTRSSLRKLEDPDILDKLMYVIKLKTIAAHSQIMGFDGNTWNQKSLAEQSKAVAAGTISFIGRMQMSRFFLPPHGSRSDKLDA